MFRSSDVWSPQTRWVDSNLERYCSSQSSYFRSYSSFRRGSFDVADHRDHEIIAKLILQPFQQLENSFGTTWQPKPIESETCRLPDANQDTSNTFCWLATQSILPMRPQNHGSRSRSRIRPIVPGQVSSVFRKMILRNQRLLNSLWLRFHWRCRWLKFCWTLWPLLQHCQAPSHWFFWRWWQRRLSTRDNPWWPRASWMLLQSLV